MTTLILDDLRDEMRRRLLAGETLEMMGASGVPYTYGPRQVLHDAVDLLGFHSSVVMSLCAVGVCASLEFAARQAIDETVRDSLFDWLRAMDKGAA